MDGSPTPRTPYREGKALAEIIPRDRRREKAIALVGASMVAGAALWALGGWALESLGASEPKPFIVGQTPGYVGGRMPASILSGPSATLAMPPRARSIVNVWLQGCQDCMPAFDAMAQLQSEGGLNLDAPTINIAYGEADAAWARRYGVATNLVFDPGGAAVVKPLGIGTFTTLVVDPDGTILHRDRPDKPGYVVRVRAAVLYGSPNARPPQPTGDPVAPTADGPAFDGAGVERVIAQHRAGLKRTCWDRAVRTATDVSVTVALTIDTDGRVTSASSTGDDPAMGKCIEAETRSWRFPPPKTPTTVNIPFKFVQE